MKGEHAVRLLCALLGVAPSGYYRWRRGGPSRRQCDDAAIAAQIGYTLAPEWRSRTRGNDFYLESALLWLEADTLIRNTTHGARIRPRLPPPATIALAKGPARYQRTAISSRKIVPAASMTPAAGARQHS